MPSRSDAAQKGPSGLTLIETIVAIAVVGILAALLIAAVQSARAAGRRAACANNLRQLGIAINTYVSSYGCFPGAVNGGGYSLHTMLLPQLDATPLFQSLNFSLGIDSGVEMRANQTSRQVQLVTFLCPADPADGGGAGRTNYAGSRGFDTRAFTDTGLFSFWSPTPVRPQDIADGLSSTAAMSEWLAGPRRATARSALGSVFDLPGALDGPKKLQGFLDSCNRVDPATAAVADNGKGSPWVQGEYIRTLYNHNLPPGRPSCISSGFIQEGAYSASSNHATGINVLWADGHVQYIKDSIRDAIWRAHGTRAGGEAVGLD